MNKKEDGFTLTEIIIVIGILGTLLAIIGVGFPKYRKFINTMQLKAESKMVLQTILAARSETVMDGETRRVRIYNSTGKIHITKLNDHRYPARRIELPSNLKIMANTYHGGHLDLYSVGTVSRGGHITFESLEKEHMTIVIQIGTGRIYLKEGMIDD